MNTLHATPQMVSPVGAPAPGTQAEGYLARQPILDRARRLMGFELLYRTASGETDASMESARLTALLLTDLFATVGMEQALGAFRGFINADAVFLNSSLVELLPPQRVVLELSENVGTDAETLGRLRQLRQQGYRLALDHYWGEHERVVPLLPFVDFVKIDLEWVDPRSLGLVVRPFQAGRVRMVATKVENAEQFQLALAHGFELFQGFHFAHPETMGGKRPPVETVGLTRLLALAVSEADDHKIEEELKRQPAMSVNLLRMVNSAAAGVRTPVKSLREALFRIGRKPLTTWIQLLLYTSGQGDGANPLLHTAALRGKLMELLAREIQPGDEDFAESALMAGIFSLMHVVFGQSQVAFAASLGIDDTVRQALDARSGRVGRLLALVERREAGGDFTGSPVPPATFARFEVEALSWASALTSLA